MTGKDPASFALRNNELSNNAKISFAGGSPLGCDAVHIGCDSRAVCATPPSGGVNCSCPKDLTPVIVHVHACMRTHTVSNGHMCSSAHMHTRKASAGMHAHSRNMHMRTPVRAHTPGAPRNALRGLHAHA